jgi:predicted outer membrane repeat protein
MILTNVRLTIKDSNFSERISTAIMLFSSTLTLVGHVSFHNNRGYQGGALMLVGAVMNIARDTKVIFHGNYAENAGGAIFVVHPQMMITAHDYVSSCFYQLIDYDFISFYDNIFSIQLVNNSAAKGGDHIYGAFLNSNCLCAFNHDFINEDI